MTKAEKERLRNVVGNLVVNAAVNILTSKKGLLPKGGLAESINFRVTDKNEIEFLTAKYYDFYVEGRKPYAKKVPISALIKWIRRYRRKLGRGRDKKGKYISDLSYAFAIQNAIYKNGIKKKQDPLQQALDISNKAIEKVVYDDFATILFEELDKFFNE